MYEGKWEDIAKKWGKTVGQAAIQGIGDGITGLRINHNLNLQVSKFEVKKP